MVWRGPSNKIILFNFKNIRCKVKIGRVKQVAILNKLQTRIDFTSKSALSPLSRIAVNKIPHYNVKARFDLYLKLLIPTAPFIVCKKNLIRKNSQNLIIIWAAEYADLIFLIFFSNPLFLNTIFFDTSAFITKNLKHKFITIFYTFKVTLFSSWLTIFLKYTKMSSGLKTRTMLISIEKLFKFAA